MLNVWFGHDCPFEVHKFNTDLIGRNLRIDDFQDPFLKAMAEDIDKLKISSKGEMYHEIFGNINPSMLSNGLCSVIAAYKFDYAVDITHMGDNCVPWLIKVSKVKDVTCNCNRVPVLSGEFKFYDIKKDRYGHTAVEFVSWSMATIMEEQEVRVLAKRKHQGQQNG